MCHNPIVIGRMKAVHGAVQDHNAFQYLISPEDSVEKDVVDSPGYPVVFGSEDGTDVLLARPFGDDAPEESRIFIIIAVPGVSLFVWIGNSISVPEIPFCREIAKNRVIFAQVEVSEQYGGLVITGRSQEVKNSVDFVLLPASDPLEPRHMVLVIPLRDFALFTASLQEVKYLRALRGARIGMGMDKKELFATDGCGSCHDETGIGEVEAQVVMVDPQSISRDLPTSDPPESKLFLCQQDQAHPEVDRDSHRPHLDTPVVDLMNLIVPQISRQSPTVLRNGVGLLKSDEVGLVLSQLLQQNLVTPLPSFPRFERYHPQNASFRESEPHIEGDDGNDRV